MNNIVKIIIYIVFGLLFFVGWIGWILCLTKKTSSFIKVMNRFKVFWKKNRRSIFWIVFYLTLLGLSSIFVFKNWDECLDIVFFSKFNGYNIIWVLWLFLLILPLITVDNQWFKISSPFNYKEKQSQIDILNSKKELEELILQIDKTDPSKGDNE